MQTYVVLLWNADQTGHRILHCLLQVSGALDGDFSFVPVCCDDGLESFCAIAKAASQRPIGNSRKAEHRWLEENIPPLS